MTDIGSQPGTSAGSGNVSNYVFRSSIEYFSQYNQSTVSTFSTHTLKPYVRSRIPRYCRRQPFSNGGSSRTTRNRTENTSVNMTDNCSQRGTSAGSGNVINHVSRSFIENFNQHNHSTASTSSTHTPKQNVRSRIPRYYRRQPSSRGGSSKTARNRTENTSVNMADNCSQPGTSAGSGNVNNYVSSKENLNQHNHSTASTSSTHTPKQNVRSRIPRYYRSQPSSSGGFSKTTRKLNVNTHNYGPIGIINQYNNLNTSSPRAPRRKPINDIERAVNTFIGRETELNNIKQLFNHYSVVVIAAMGGMGKTQLARKFAAVNEKRYRDRCWINAETKEQLLKSFDRLAKKVKVDANTDINTVRDTYRSFTEGAALLIFDNVEHVNNVYRYLPTRIQLEDITLHVLVTSRWTDWTPDSLVNCYQLKPMDISTSLQIFQTKFGQTCLDTMQDEWEELAGMLGNLPLALQVATSYIYKRYKHNSDLTTILADYMKQLKEGADALLNNPLPEYDNRTVYVSMMLTLQQLENKADNESNLQNSVQWQFAVTIINCVAYMYPDRIEKKRLLKLVDNPENICKLDEALAILSEYSLLNQGDGWKGDTFYSVHRIIQTSIRHNQTLMGTADKYYIRVFKCNLAEKNTLFFHYFKHEAQYANERAAAVAVYYKNKPSPGILKYLVRYKAVTAMEAVLQLCKNQIQIALNRHDLLHRAVENGHLIIIQLLCKYGADINQQCREEGGPPLHCALESGFVEIAKWLLENGAAPTVRDRDSRNALHAAIGCVNHKMVPIIIKTDRAVVNQTDNIGRTPLLSIDYSHNEKDILSITRILVKSGADVTAVDKWGNTALHSVTSSACAAAVSLILQLNKDLVNIVNRYGKTALHVIPYDNTYIDDERILSTMRVLIESGGDLTKMDKEGDTVLHLAAKGACASAVSLILQRNNDLVTIVNKNGETALHVIPYDNTYIVDERILSTMRVLIDSGVDLTKVDKEGNTVLHLASSRAYAVAVELILQLNKDLVNIVNEDGQTALHVIPYYNTRIDDERILSTMRVLIESGGDLTKMDKEGDTVLHLAASGACAVAIKLILQLNEDLVNIN